MKTIKIFGSVLAIASLIVACSKKDTTPTPAPGPTTCTMTRDISTNGGYSDTSVYTYNASKKLVRASSYYTKDTVIYNVSGQLSVQKEFSYPNWTTPSKTWTYTYTGSNLTGIVEIGTNNSTTYTATSVYSYSGSLLTQLQTTGSPDNVKKISSITWSNGNIATATLDLDGTGTVLIPVTAAYDTKKNNSRFVPPHGGGDIIGWISTNNILYIQTAAIATIDTITYPAGTKLFENTSLTYNSNDELTGMTELPSVFNTGGGNSTVHVYTYNCQ